MLLKALQYERLPSGLMMPVRLILSENISRCGVKRKIINENSN